MRIYANDTNMSRLGKQKIEIPTHVKKLAEQSKKYFENNFHKYI